MTTATAPSIAQILRANNDPEIKRSIDAVMRAFENDPVARWLFPENENYYSVFPLFVRAYASCAIETGKIHFLSGFAGAAFWQAPGEHSDEEAILKILKDNLHGAHLDAALMLLEKTQPYHPTQPHWYLPVLGVDPNFQSCGLGSNLIRHQLQFCDQERLPVFLESSNRANLSFYERHGFKLLDEINIGNSPSLFPMIREAHKQ